MLFAASQNKFAASFFDYGKPREFSGSISLRPYPTMAVDSGKPAYLLVAPGKHGADGLVAGDDGAQVRLKGTLIHRAEGQMIEIEPASITKTGEIEGAASETKDLGEMTLQGEIVDTKCYLGVMNPGEGKVHRDCAARCLSGGIPPALVTKDLDGSSRVVLLIGGDGHPLGKSAWQAVIGQPVSMRGRVKESQGLFYLQTSAADIVALP